MTEIKERVVYVITRTSKADDDNTDIYVGSTSYSLKKRLCEHRSTARGAGNENNKLYERMREVGVDSWKITPLLSQLCDKKTIRELEREKCSELNADLNTLSPIRTPDEKRQYDAAYSAAYYEKNKQKKRYYCEVCDISFGYNRDLQKHLKTSRHFWKYIYSVD